MAADLMTESFIKQEASRIEPRVALKSKLQSSKRSDDTNYWDAANFSCLSNNLPVYPRVSKGFISFDRQTNRKNMLVVNANESRFLSLNPFPSTLSTVTHSREISFRK